MINYDADYDTEVEELASEIKSYAELIRELEIEDHLRKRP